MDLRRRRLLGTGLVAVLVVGLALAAAAANGAFSGLTPAQIDALRAARAAARLRAAEVQAVQAAEGLVAVRLPTRPGSPAPDPPATLFRHPLRGPHQVIGYVPYWTMADLTPADYADATALAYYGPTLAPTGRLAAAGPGWAELSRAGFARLVTAAHAAGDRVLLTVATVDPAVISAVLANPARTAARLADQLVPLLAADHLDGVSLDIEGRSSAERARFVAFVTDLSAHLRQADPHVELVLDVYPQSAGNPGDFFDVAALAHQVDLLFVMAYDMEDPTHPSAGAPLASPTLGLSDVQTVLAYEHAVPARKLVLGVPFYGYDFTLRPPGPPGGRTTRDVSVGGSAAGGAPAAAGPPVAVTYAAVAAIGRPARWDPASLTPYTVFRAGGKDHETFYDNPVSVALKTALAEHAGLAGTGAWALGDEGGATDMLQALDGGRRPVKLPLEPGPTPTAVAAARRAAG